MEHRVSARVITLNAEGLVLLFHINDPLTTKPPAWITPGGGVEPGEAIGAAACREMREETGLVVTEADLGPLVAVSRGEWEFRGEPLFSEDWYYALRTSTFEPDDSGWTELERDIHRGWQWWSAEELASTAEVVFPAGLAGLVHDLNQGKEFGEPRELPWRNS